uniref:Uncharacterized protein n=1 Tax=Cannabis sativa TaxID=3483 RepID=A0A803NIA9_CANSA
MRVFLLPQSVIKEIEKFCRGFLWGLKDNRPKIHLASWEKVCLPKALGGLGFKDGSRWNKASLARFIWDIMNKKDLLWVKWVNAVYLKGASLWTYNLKADTSWYWKKLYRLRMDYTQQEIDSAGAVHSNLLTRDMLSRFQIVVENTCCAVCGTAELHRSVDGGFVGSNYIPSLEE